MDNAFIQELYRRYGYVIHGRCCRVLGDSDEAWDATQAVFLKLIEQYDRIRNRDAIVSWLYTSAQRHCFNMLRARKKTAGALDPDLIADAAGLEGRLEARSVIRVLMEVQDRRVQEAVYYTYVEGLEQEEIRSLTGQSPATIRRNLARFKDSVARLKQRLTQ